GRDQERHRRLPVEAGGAREGREADRGVTAAAGDVRLETGMETQTSVSTVSKNETAPAAPDKKVEAPKRTLGVSAQAVEAIRRQMAKRGTPDAAIREGVRGGGCSGFSYVIEYEDQPARPGYIVMEFADEG